jgi:hypothetical protein
VTFGTVAQTDSEHLAIGISNKKQKLSVIYLASIESFLGATRCLILLCKHCRPRWRLPHLSGPLSKGSFSCSFYVRVRTLLFTCLVGSFLIDCFRARGGALTSEAARGYFGSVITTGAAVEGVEGRKNREDREVSWGSSLTSCFTSCFTEASFLTLFFLGIGVGTSGAAVGLDLGVGALGSYRSELCLQLALVILSQRSQHVSRLVIPHLQLCLVSPELVVISVLEVL